MSRKRTTWTQFMDMHSGGGLKEKWSYIYIEAPPSEAEIIFYNRFGHNPHRVSCTCCGQDYSLSEEPSLAQATAYNRGMEHDGKRWKGKSKYAEKVIPLKEYLKRKEVLVIYKKDIKPKERHGFLPQQGYVWV